MSNLIEQLAAQFGPAIAEQLSSNFKGVDQNNANGVLSDVLPMIVGGLKRQMDSHGGEARLEHILDKYGNESALHNMGDHFRQYSGASSNHDPDLGGLLGGAGNNAASAFSDALGIGKGQAGNIIAALAPIILGMLKQKSRVDGTQGVSGLAGLLDRDGDGQILDDVASLVISAMSKGQVQQAPVGNAGGGLGGILGSLLGGGR